jgi:N-acetylglucosaminyl-diphospho-decaprenol L-rhamnosyltransferase
MTGNNPWVRIVIVNYNAGAMLRSCIDALANQTMAAFEAVIVDNASTIQPISDLHLPDDRFQIRDAGDNIGFAAATNLGAQGSTLSWIATLNPDTRPRPDWLAELRSATERYGRATMFGSTQLAMDNPEIVDGFGDVLSAFGSAWRSGNSRSVRELPENDCEVFSPCAAAALYARSSFEREGGFDESFFCYLEDVDLGFRLRLRGERCVQVRRAEVLHAGSAISGHLSDFSVFHSYRNRIWLFAKNVPGPLLPPVFTMQSAAIALSLARPAARRYRRAALKGVWAGLRGLPSALKRRPRIQQFRVRSIGEVARMMIWNPLKSRPRGRIQVFGPAQDSQSPTGSRGEGS